MPVKHGSGCIIPWGGFSPTEAGSRVDLTKLLQINSGIHLLARTQLQTYTQNYNEKSKLKSRSNFKWESVARIPTQASRGVLHPVSLSFLLQTNVLVCRCAKFETCIHMTCIHWELVQLLTPNHSDFIGHLVKNVHLIIMYYFALIYSSEFWKIHRSLWL